MHSTIHKFAHWCRGSPCIRNPADAGCGRPDAPAAQCPVIHGIWAIADLPHSPVRIRHGPRHLSAPSTGASRRPPPTQSTQQAPKSNTKRRVRHVLEHFHSQDFQTCHGQVASPPSLPWTPGHPLCRPGFSLAHQLRSGGAGSLRVHAPAGYHRFLTVLEGELELQIGSGPKLPAPSPEPLPV